MALLLTGLVACRPGPDAGSSSSPPRVIVPERVASPRCAPAKGVALQVLGSGGPIPDDGRASASYLVWIDGRARVLLDAGGGSFLRFGEAGARLEDLDAIALTHLHTDHSAELPALLKGGFFSSRRRDLLVAGPSGRGSFPGLAEYLDATFGPSGAYRYLGWLLDERGASSLLPRQVDADSREPRTVLERSGLVIEALGVEHGPVPALAYRVRTGGTTIVVGGDQNGNNPEFVELARDADLLVMHHAVPEDTDPVARRLHARPSEIGTVAAAADAETLVLSHHMKRSLADLERGTAEIRARFTGPVVVAEDLMCLVP